MKIGFLTSSYARPSHTFMRREVARLRELGHEVFTFSVRRPAASEVVGPEVRAEYERTEHLLMAGPLRLAAATVAELFRSPRRFLEAARRVGRLGTPGLKGRIWPLFYLVEGAYLARRLRGRGIEHLHNHLGRNSAAIAMVASTLTDIPYSLTIHGPTEFDEPKALALGEKVRHAAFAVAISDYGRSQLCRWSNHADWSKIHVVRCGVDESYLSEIPGEPPSAPRLVCVGRLAEQKGQLVLVEAAARLRERGVPLDLVLVGDGPMRPEIERLVASRGLGDCVRLLGWRDGPGVRREILASRALVLPSFAEGLPVVMMEALALGRPVIGTYIAGIPELIEPGVSGWLIRAGSVEALVAAMHEALTADPAVLARMGRHGASRVAECHDARIEATKLAGLIAATRVPEPPETLRDADTTLGAEPVGSR